MLSSSASSYHEISPDTLGEIPWYNEVTGAGGAGGGGNGDTGGC